MAERPFMQLYGSDFVGDTLHLSNEQIGAYFLLLIAMWNAGGSLPAQDVKLARIARCTLARWVKISGDILPLFEADDETIWHKRQRKDLKNLEEKRLKNRQSGSLGGRAKALKDRDAGLANANKTPQRKAGIARATPEPEPEIERETNVSPKSTARGSRLPADWVIPNEWGKWAVEEFGESSSRIRSEADKFRDYWIAQPGQKGVKLDWQATWRNWCRNAFAKKAAGPARSSRPESAAELSSRILREMEEADERNSEVQGNRSPAQQHALPSPRQRDDEA